MRAMIASVAAHGYAKARIADVVARARVSRQSFYAVFPDKEACFLAAHNFGLGVIFERLVEFAAQPPPADTRQGLRLGLRAYLGLAAGEPEFAYCMLVELPATGPEGLRARREAHSGIAELLREWHQGVRAAAGWPEVPPSRYAAAVGAVHDMLFKLVAEGAASTAATLEADAFDAVATLLEIPPR